MSHLTFYRKYRSQNFDEIIGQQHIVQTLKNAIENDRLSHAYIFSGPRGTGKTSIARIFAKTLNCTPNMDINDCPICERISQGNCVDVIEMDAASNTGVDHIRVLNEQVKFAPVECKYKLFIIDEVHMLSTGAFNALLKTMEEPPENTIFICATTEPQKIPATIHSRCQHLQFKTLTLNELTTQLRHIADQESINVPDKALNVIARQAGGCMRDAISLFDQIYSFRGNDIAYDDVFTILGSANFDHLITLMTAFFNQDEVQTMTQLQVIFDDGANMQQLANDLTTFLKMALFVKLGLHEAIDLDEARITQLADLTKPVSPAFLKDVLEGFAKLEMELRSFPNPQILCQIRFLTYLELDRGEVVHSPSVQSTSNQTTPNHSTPNQTTSNQAVKTAVPVQGDSASSTLSSAQQATPSFSNEVVPPKPEPIDVKPTGNLKVVPKVSNHVEVNQVQVNKVPEPSPVTPANTINNQISVSDIKEPKMQDISDQLSETVSPKTVVKAEQTDVRITQPNAGQNTDSAMSSAGGANEAPSSNQEAIFNRVIEQVKEQNAGLYFMISGAKLVGITDDMLMVTLPRQFKFTTEKLREPANASFLRSLVTNTFQKEMGLTVGQDLIFKVQSQSASQSMSQTGSPSQDIGDDGVVIHQEPEPSIPSEKINTIISMFEGKVVS